MLAILRTRRCITGLWPVLRHSSEIVPTTSAGSEALREVLRHYVTSCQSPEFHSNNCRYFSSSTPSPRDNHAPPRSEDELVLEWIRKGDLEKVHKVLGSIYHETEAVLQEITFFRLIRKVARVPKMKETTRYEVMLGFLDIYLRFHQAGRLDKPLQIDTFAAAMYAFSTSNGSKAGELTESFLWRITQLSDQKILPFGVSLHFYSMAMMAYASRGNPERVQAIFDRCVHRYQQRKRNNKTGFEHPCPKPDSFLWHTLIKAYASSGRPEAGLLADLKLKEMRDAFQKGQLEEPPNSFCYNCVIQGWRMSKRPNEAEKVLEEMYLDYTAGNQRAKPNMVSFLLVMTAHSESGTLEGAQRTEAILNHMKKLTDQGTLSILPEDKHYNTVGMAYGRLGMPREAERLLRVQYEDFKSGNASAEPVARSYVPVLIGWSKSNEAVRGEQAELILNHIEHLYTLGELKERPHAHAYTIVMQCWRDACEPEKARKVFERMVKDHKSGNVNARPQNTSFCVLLSAYAKARLPDAGPLADDLLYSMSELNVKPSVQTLTATVQCWICSLGHDERAKRRIAELNKEIDARKRRKSKSIPEVRN